MQINSYPLLGRREIEERKDNESKENKMKIFSPFLSLIEKKRKENEKKIIFICLF